MKKVRRGVKATMILTNFKKKLAFLWLNLQGKEDVLECNGWHRRNGRWVNKEIHPFPLTKNQACQEMLRVRPYSELKNPFTVLLSLLDHPEGETLPKK